jgi:PST family polysaccharide transporter
VNIIPTFLRSRIEHRPNLLKIIDNVGWLFFDRIFRLGVGLFIGVWLARYLGPEQYGILSFSTAFVGLFGTFAMLGLQNVVVRDLVIDPEETNTTLGTAAALQLIGGLFAFAVLSVFICFLRPDDTLTRLLVVILGSTLVFKAADFTKYWFEARVQSKYTVWMINVVFLFMVAVKIVLILLHSPLLAFVWALFAEGLLISVALLCIYALQGPGLKGLHFKLSRATSLLRDSWPLILTGVAIAIYMKIDQVMLGQVLGDEAVGIYSVAVRISEVWYFIPMAIVASVFPAILDAKKQSQDLYHRRLQQLYDLMVGLSLALAVPMTFLSDWVVELLFGEAYLQAGTVLAIHIWAAIFVFLGVASGKWILAENRQILSFQRALSGAVINIVLNWFFIPRFGIYGAAWATVISYAVSGMFYDLFNKETQFMFVMKFKSFNLYRLIKHVPDTAGK